MRNILIAPLLHVVLITHDEDPDLTAVPMFPPGEQVRHQQRQTLNEKNTAGKNEECLYLRLEWVNIFLPSNQRGYD